jgi:hypothetical protein
VQALEYRVVGEVRCDALRVVSIDGGLPSIENGSQDLNFGTGHDGLLC